MQNRSWTRVARLTLLGAASALAACSSTKEAEVTASAVQDRVELRAGDTLFAVFRLTDATPAAYYPLLAADDVPVTRGFPFEDLPGEERDHPHHVSLWFAHGDVDGHDFWHGEGGARIVTRFVDASDERVLTRHGWTVGERTLLEERRTTTFGTDSAARWLDVELVLRPREVVTFGDTKEGTFALRLAPTLRADGEIASGILLNSEGLTGSDVWGERARWVAAQGVVGETPVTVALFDHPRNLRHPTWWHARTYGLLAANPFGRRAFEDDAGDDGALRLTEPLELRYRVWLSTGPRAAAEIDAAWSAFASVGFD